MPGDIAFDEIADKMKYELKFKKKKTSSRVYEVV